MPTREEIESVITWTAADEKASVYSLMPRIWKQCIRAGGVEINHEQGIREGRKVGRTFLVDPDCFGIRPKRKLSPAERQRRQEQARGLRNATVTHVLNDADRGQDDPRPGPVQGNLADREEPR